jgi:hypothetical protein
MTSEQPNHIAGTLALDPVSDAPRRAWRYALIVERDPALARRLMNALSERFAQRLDVGLVSHAAAFPRAQAADTPHLLVVDANQPGVVQEATCELIDTVSELDGAQIIYISGDTSFGLSQRGATGGVLVRSSACLDEIIELIAAIVEW